MLDRLWPSTVTANWDNRSMKAARFQMVGTNNRAILEGMLAGLHFHQAIGSERIYNRIHQLASQVRQRAASSPILQLLTPADDRMYGSLVTFTFKRDPKPFFELCKKRRIWTTGSERLRVSTHIHTRPEDVDTLFKTMEEALG
jgi:selenocysteine lyase/cysteine desulfurase